MRKLLNFKIVLVFVSVVVIVCIASVQAKAGISGDDHGGPYDPFASGFHLAPLPSNSANYVPDPQLSPPLGPGNSFKNDGNISDNASDRAKFVTNIVIPSRVRHRSPCHPGS